MKHTITVELTREIVVEMLASYARQATPSALESMLAEAVGRAADRASPADRELLLDAAARLRTRSEQDRALEDAFFSGRNERKASSVRNQKT